MEAVLNRKLTALKLNPYVALYACGLNVFVVAKVNKTGPMKLIPLINPRIICSARMSGKRTNVKTFKTILDIQSLGGTVCFLRANRKIYFCCF